MKTLQHRQTQEASGFFGLSMLTGIRSPYFRIDRYNNLIPRTMAYKVIVSNYETDLNNLTNLSATISVIDTSINQIVGGYAVVDLTNSVITDAISLRTEAITEILAYMTAQSMSITSSDIIFPEDGVNLPARSFSTPSLAVNTSRQPSTTRDTMVNASVDITSTISLTTGQIGKVALQYADNTGFTTNVVTVQSATNGNTGSLTIGLNLSQVYTAALTGIVPAGKYYRLVTTNITGTPTYGTPVIQEVLL